MRRNAPKIVSETPARRRCLTRTRRSFSLLLLLVILVELLSVKMKLDATNLRYLDQDDFRTLTAVELGMRNHDQVPVELIGTLSGVRQVRKCARTLLRHKLVHHESVPFESFRLTSLGYDYLALRALRDRGVVFAVGHQFGTGKESDIHVVAGGASEDDGKRYALKVHRLGRTSFRTVRTRRDYCIKGDRVPDIGDEGLFPQGVPLPASLPAASVAGDGQLMSGGQQSEASHYRTDMQRSLDRAGGNGRETPFGRRRKVTNWLYMSRLAALREFAFLRVLFDRGFPVPEPVEVNRHCIVMSLVENADPLFQLRALHRPVYVMQQMVDFAVRLARCGLVHGDLNEFNVLVDRDTEDVVVIDFPQMVSTAHPEAAEMFARDMIGIRNFFVHKFGLVSELDVPTTFEGIERSNGRTGSECKTVQHEILNEFPIERVEHLLDTLRMNHDASDVTALHDGPRDRAGQEESGTAQHEERPTDAGTHSNLTSISPGAADKVSHRVRAQMVKQRSRARTGHRGNRLKNMERRKAVAELSDSLWH